MATKQLAKQLGLIRRSSKTSQTSSNVSRPKARQFFEYLIIIDFESTCWKDGKHSTQEIIEFPAVLLNVSNGEIESEFHTYVQPQEHPILSDFCTELTGINQQQVDDGVPLKICLSQFNSWIQKLQKEKGIAFVTAVPTHSTAEHKMCAFVTWSDWDLGVCLLYECRRKQMKKPDILNSWIDLRATYKLFYNRRPKGLNGALQDLGIEFSGREHSGLDDSRNTAKLASRMICDGCVMKITKSLDKVNHKISYTRPQQVLPAQDSNSVQVGTIQTSEMHSEKNPQPSFDKTAACVNVMNLQKDLEPSSLKINGKPIGRDKAVTMLNGHQGQESLPSQTLINGLSTTLGNGPKRCFTNRTSLGTLQTGVSLGAFTSTPAELPSLGSGHVLMSTTVTSVTDISALDISSTSDCLSMLADWEDAAVIEDSQEEPSVPTTEQSDLLMAQTSVDVTLPGTNMANCNRNQKYGSFHPHSIAYQSRNTTIYNINVKQNVSSCSTFKVPGVLARRSTNMMPTSAQLNKMSTSLPSFPKRKLSSVSFYSPPKKQPFIIHEDKCSSNNRSLPVISSRPHNVPPTVLNATVNNTFKSAQTGKITAPMCNCGRRAKRLTVSNAGPNQGKAFYTCSVKKRNEENKKGCDYFKWEQTVVKEKSAQSTIILSKSGISFSSNTSFTAANSASRRSFVSLRPSMRT
ncbi:ERI1 exoribonuclease 2 [Xenopus laevis]|uniref:ERI1 exoribonuclease 2 n=1 Tax=Xenopus laevis TaxID=8355 RepID=ERI2_XENLA|nr:ERI1 exoribonuclease 2 [Xenopus laevis]Q5HZL1.1 RecName: Full=ERI1 exoribonuclease 2; AltName: Full=Exonuclease domain-containing protein 1 [Xenopus laevis]AAH88972.1 Exod1 protein [Xenopus laevis]